MPAKPQFQTYDEFWLFYLREHAVAWNRRLHFTGTTLALGVLGVACFTQNWVLLVAVPFLGYGPAWVGHFFIEKNKPASFQYPFWSLVSDLRMWGLVVTGQMRGELKRANIGTAK